MSELGATFYHMLHGLPPFEPTPNDPLALVHKHIAVQPIPLQDYKVRCDHSYLFNASSSDYHSLFQVIPALSDVA